MFLHESVSTLSWVMAKGFFGFSEHQRWHSADVSLTGFRTEFGSLFVKVVIQIPQHLSEEELTYSGNWQCCTDELYLQPVSRPIVKSTCSALNRFDLASSGMP